MLTQHMLNTMYRPGHLAQPYYLGTLLWCLVRDALARAQLLLCCPFWVLLHFIRYMSKRQSERPRTPLTSFQ